MIKLHTPIGSYLFSCEVAADLAIKLYIKDRDRFIKTFESNRI